MAFPKVKRLLSRVRNVIECGFSGILYLLQCVVFKVCGVFFPSLAIRFRPVLFVSWLVDSLLLFWLLQHAGLLACWALSQKIEFGAHFERNMRLGKEEEKNGGTKRERKFVEGA